MPNTGQDYWKTGFMLFPIQSVKGKQTKQKTTFRHIVKEHSLFNVQGTTWTLTPPVEKQRIRDQR